MAAKFSKNKQTTAFGDFQTPLALAQSSTSVIRSLGICPKAILEPTCGRGSFVVAALSAFPDADSIIGIEVNAEHLAGARRSTETISSSSKLDLIQGDFFCYNWADLIKGKPGPWLILGNPPWVTSSTLSSIASDNLPEKSNFHGRTGIEAVTGKSNFDISEWMLLRYLDWLKGAVGTIAVLCKTSVARKILHHIWKTKYPIKSARLYKIDALSSFEAAVDACFFVIETSLDEFQQHCEIFDSLESKISSQCLSFFDGHLISDRERFEKSRSILGVEEHYTWRSGIKHDCSRIMELTTTDAGYENGLGELVQIEESFLYPMLKSSGVSNQRPRFDRVMLVPQRVTGQDTSHIKLTAPLTWEYLNRHSALLEKRGSVIYRNKPSFSVFGIGPYSFSPWKVAISGFYKKLNFVSIGPVANRPVVFDDTVYFLSCWSEEEAKFIEGLLNSDAAHDLYQSMVYWPDKRPITVDLLRRLNIRKLSVLLGRERDYNRFVLSTDFSLIGVLQTGKLFSQNQRTG